MLSLDFFKESLDSCAILDNKYRILQTIGEGRYAKVKLAYNINNKKKYAIKIMKEDQINTTNKLECFLSEVEILSGVQNSHIIQIEEANLSGEYKKRNGVVHKVVYYAMKFAEYGELFRIIQEAENFSEPLSRYYFHQLVESVEYLHKKGIGHRDIKTENILIDHKFRLKLADFGCACKIWDESNQRITFNNQIPVGSPEFNPPEITNNSIKKDYYAEPADVFATGAVLFVMICKSNPFNTSLYTDPYYLRLIKPDTEDYWKIFDQQNLYSPEFKDLVEKMMKSNPNERISFEDVKKHPWYLGPLPTREEVEFEIIKIGNKIVTGYENKLRQKRNNAKRKAPNSMMENKFPQNRNTTKIETFRLKMQQKIKEINDTIAFQAERRKKQKLEIKRTVLQIEEKCKEDSQERIINSLRIRRRSDPSLPKIHFPAETIRPCTRNHPLQEPRRVYSAEQNVETENEIFKIPLPLNSDSLDIKVRGLENED